MGVSLECYRLRIGCFISRKRKQTIMKTKPNDDNSNFLFSLLLLYLIISQNVICNKTNIGNKSKKPTQSSYVQPKENLPDQVHYHFLSGPYLLSTKKACHMFSGNRALGYKIASWNIERGLISPGDGIWRLSQK